MSFERVANLDARRARIKTARVAVCAALVAIACNASALGQRADQSADQGVDQSVDQSVDKNEPALVGSAPRPAGVPDTVPNISGVWQNRGYDRLIKPSDGSETPWQPWTRAAFEQRTAAEKAGRPMYDPTAACLPSGIPRIIAAPYPVEIIQTKDSTVFLQEVQHLFWVVHMNAPHPDKVTPSFFGHSVGNWEGDTLVIDTIGLVPNTQIDEAGTLHSDHLHVVQRIRKVKDTLDIQFTIDDPKAFTRSWTARRVWYWRPDVRFLEYICEENNRNAPDASGTLKNF